MFGVQSAEDLGYGWAAEQEHSRCHREGTT